MRSGVFTKLFGSGFLASHRHITWINTFLVICCMFVMASAAWAGPVDRFERLVMPGKLSTGHVKYEKDCKNCHSPFEKGAQNSLCMDCHKDVGKDVKAQEGFHGRITDVGKRACSVCHKEHRGREADIVPFDRDTFDHRRTDFVLRGTHAALACSDCHRKEKKYRKVPSDCYGCHENDDSHEKNLGKKCNQCHVEDVWAKAHFNHDRTKFKLKDIHRSARCADCHPNQRYKNTPKTCITCHKAEDVHKGERGEKCEDCHTQVNWASIKFNHDKDTKYKLHGRHVSVSCKACHGNDVYKKIKSECVTCHKKDDSHRGLFGDKCQDCHNENSWSKMIFNHTKDTKFPLKGKHVLVECNACHKGKVYGTLEKDCYSCHRQDDMHEGQEGKKCDKCHKETGWGKNVFFDHDLTGFPLLDSHKIVPCEECHQTDVFRNADIHCKSCHRHDDARTHKKRLGQNCELCHNANDWRKWFFNHDTQTKYKLTGAHKGLTCYGCHRTVVKDKIKLAKDCYSCHEVDDYHHGAFGKQCERCHVTKSWKELSLNK